MTTQTPDDLRVMLRAALTAYEQAQAVRLQEQRRTEEALARDEAQRNAADQATRAQWEAEHKRRLAVAGGEQARLAQLLAETTALEEAAQALLKSAGLAHIAGAPTAVDGAPAPARRSDAEVTAAFTSAHTAFVQLRTALYQLAKAQVDAGRWGEARQTLQPLLAAKDAPLYTAASELERASYLQPAQQALAAGQWEAARGFIEPWLKGHKEDGEAAGLERASYLRPAQQALDARQWNAARQQVDLWLKRVKNDQEIIELGWESFYRPGQQALTARQFELACAHLEGLAVQQVVYKDSATLLQNACRSLPRQTHPKIKGLEFVKIPSGFLLYGEGKERVEVAAFWIATTPITAAQYKQFVAGWTVPSGQENHPVVNVSWEDAQQFCGKAGVRLPLEREWEKAARGADGREYPWGNQAPNSTLCNFSNQVGGTTPVGNYPQGASPYGVLDMAGNVWEWCEDAYDGTSRVLRGGAFNFGANLVRCAYRYWDTPTNRDSCFGFRVVAPSF